MRREKMGDEAPVSKASPKTTVTVFHQFVKVERGPVNAAVIDLLKGNVYQVPNRVIDKLESGRYDEIPEFIASAREEGLLMEIEPHRWIPENEWDLEPMDEEEAPVVIELHVEAGVDLEGVLRRLAEVTLSRVVYYGPEPPALPVPHPPVVQKEKDFRACTAKAAVNGEFSCITEAAYLFNRKCNSCWGERMAITADGKIRPCIHSRLCLGSVTPDLRDVDGVIEKLRQYWSVTKDKVAVCRECELRHVCFDCREIARRRGGDLFAPNPLCRYDPRRGTWNP